MTAVTNVTASRADHRDAEPRPAGFVARRHRDRGPRAARACPATSKSVIPPVFIALFFFLVNVGTLQQLTEQHIPGFDYTAFQMPTAILLGVTGISRAPALVHRRPRRLLRPAAAHARPPPGDPARPSWRPTSRSRPR